MMTEMTEDLSRYADDEQRWQAVLDRDSAAEGEFYYAVASTGIYCRPTCPARRPKREHVRFFSAADAAEAAGYRACLRCRPTEISAQQRLVAHVQHLLDTAESIPTLAELGRSMDVSPFHLQRLFRRATGLSPRDYARSRRREQLKEALHESSSVVEAQYDAGYGSSRALYAAANADLGMSPGVYRRGGSGREVNYVVADCPLGRMLIAATSKGICALYFGDDDEALLHELRVELPKAVLKEDPSAMETYVRAVGEHLQQHRASLDLPLDARGTEFQHRVWTALRSIPAGETRTYSEIAASIGEPAAVRAVAHACATNPISLLVPCHRVVRRDGGLAGYRWGIQRKQALLAGEESTRNS
ncbi:MAG: AraC family transcriptional regulator [Chloroflexota bacterium]|jgi:AraC family transcriptional regulator of adaptative response/methylated-DNA-[protein]-cysteine methyltransferase|nr:AraC family transcriptional regulator [Chloroflexota bacterium]